MNRRILIIDDSAAFTKLLTHILQNKYEISVARNGLEGFSILHGTFSPDLIICDLNMPELDGTAFLTELQNSGLYSCIPVIVMTGEPIQAETIDITEDLQTRIITKPFTPEDLFQKIDELFALVNVAEV
jgi:CheY-like chemotaxis protein